MHVRVKVIAPYKKSEKVWNYDDLQKVYGRHNKEHCKLYGFVNY